MCKMAQADNRLSRDHLPMAILNHVPSTQLVKEAKSERLWQSLKVRDSHSRPPAGNRKGGNGQGASLSAHWEEIVG
jgi:hypothetical protein